MSFAAQTWTVDTASSPWVYPDGQSTTVNGTSETISFTGVDTGAGGRYYGLSGNTISLADGTKLKIEGDQGYVYFKSEADGATVDNGSWWVRHDDGKKEEVKIYAMNLTDGDGVGANNLVAISFEYPGKPYRWSWANINTA